MHAVMNCSMVCKYFGTVLTWHCTDLPFQLVPCKFENNNDDDDGGADIKLTVCSRNVT